MRPLIVAPQLESELARMWSPDGGLAPDPQTALHVRETVARYAADPAYAPHAIVVTAPLRPLLAEFLERTLPGIAVYAYAELPPEIALEPTGVLEASIAADACRGAHGCRERRP